ncbi:MAG: aspartate/glutamate racemase family protein [Alcanivorax sp.]
MKTVGIIGGLSPESTILYYQGINQGVRARLGGHHAGRVLIDSLDFGEFVALKEKGDWETQSKLLCNAARNLEKGGADFIILATNTMHKMAEDITASVSIPFLHLADATADQIIADEINTVALLGTRYTMELDFYKGRLESKGIDVLIPDDQGRADVHNIIYDELCNGKVSDRSRARYIEIINQLRDQGAQGVILGCTEIGMLIKASDLDIQVFDTTEIHIQAALNTMFEEL